MIKEIGFNAFGYRICTPWDEKSKIIEEKTSRWFPWQNRQLISFHNPEETPFNLYQVSKLSEKEKQNNGNGENKAGTFL